MEDLAADSDLIVIGKVGPEVFKHDIKTPLGDVAKTDVFHSFTVEEVLAGEVARGGSEIMVGYWLGGGENVTPYRSGERLLLFLAAYDAEGAENNTWVPLASNTGVFEFVDDDSTVSRGIVGPIAGVKLDVAEARDLETS
ncbi:MAG TPA: hypothetical protein VID03_10165 [Acidimicrobiia bacterium]